MTTVAATTAADKAPRRKKSNGDGSFRKYPGNAPDRRVRMRVTTDLPAGIKSKDVWGRTETACRQALAAWKLAVANVVVVVPGAETVGSWIAGWLARKSGTLLPNGEAEGSVADSTLQRLEGQTRRILATLDLDMGLAALSAEHLELAMATWATDGVGAPTRIHLLRQLRQMLKEALAKGKVSANVASQVPFPPYEPEEHPEYDPSRLRKLLAAAARADFGSELERLRIIAAVELGSAAGLRRGEIGAARWRHFREADGTLLVAEHVVKLKGRSVIKKGGKSSKGKSRRVWLLPTTVAALQALRAAAPLSMDPDAWIFPSADGTDPLHPDWLTKGIKRLLVATGYPDLSLHDLRHDYAGMAHTLGISDATAAQQMGHTLQIHLSTYVHAADIAAESARDQMVARLRAAS